MAIQCAEAQTLTLAKLAPPHTATHKTRPPTAELPHEYVAWAVTTLFLRSSGHFNTDPPVEQVCWSDVYERVCYGRVMGKSEVVPGTDSQRRWPEVLLWVVSRGRSTGYGAKALSRHYFRPTDNRELSSRRLMSGIGLV